jgi:hypothetical protein
MNQRATKRERVFNQRLSLLYDFSPNALRFSSLIFLACYPLSALAGDGDYGALFVPIFGGLAGLILGALITLFLPTKKGAKIIAIIPMMALGCALGVGLSMLALKLGETPEQKARIESQKGYPSLFQLSCSGDDAALAQYLEKVSVEIRSDGNSIAKALSASANPESCTKGVPLESMTMGFRTNTFVILARALNRSSPNGEYCKFLRYIHTARAMPQLQLLRKSELPIFCELPSEDPPWAHLHCFDKSLANPKLSEDVWLWLRFLKDEGMDFKKAPSHVPTFISKVICNGDPRLIRFALEEGSDPRGFSDTRLPREIWQERLNLMKDNPYGYAPLSGYTSAENVAGIAYITRRLVETTK